LHVALISLLRDFCRSVLFQLSFYSLCAIGLSLTQRSKWRECSEYWGPTNARTTSLPAGKFQIAISSQPNIRSSSCLIRGSGRAFGPFTCTSKFWTDSNSQKSSSIYTWWESPRRKVTGVAWESSWDGPTVTAAPACKFAFGAKKIRENLTRRRACVRYLRTP